MLLLPLLLLQVRDPVAGVFSAETMLRGMGVPLTWSLTEPVVKSMEALEEGLDTRFKVRCTRWGPRGLEGSKGLKQTTEHVGTSGPQPLSIGNARQTAAVNLASLKLSA